MLASMCTSRLATICVEGITVRRWKPKMQIQVVVLLAALTACRSERDTRKIEVANGNHNFVDIMVNSSKDTHSSSLIVQAPEAAPSKIHSSSLVTDAKDSYINVDPIADEDDLKLSLDGSDSKEYPAPLQMTFRNLNLNASHFPSAFARRGNSSISFNGRKGRSEDLDVEILEEEEEEQIESLDSIFPEALVQSHNTKNSFSRGEKDQDYLTFSSVGEMNVDDSYYDESEDEPENLDDIKASALVSSNGYSVEEVIENLDDLTAGALIANYLFEDEIDHPEKPSNTSKFLKDNLYDLDNLLDGTGVNASVLLSAVDTLRKAGGLQNLLKATKGGPLSSFALLAGGTPAGGAVRPGGPVNALGGMNPLMSAGMNNLGTLGGAMKHQDMDEIRRELKGMMFGDERKYPQDGMRDEPRRGPNRPPYTNSPPSQQRIGQPQRQQVPTRSSGPPSRYGPQQNTQPRDYQASGTRPQSPFPPPPPIRHNKNLDFGGYVRIHLPSIMAQMKGHKGKEKPKSAGYQRPGYFRNNHNQRNFKPSDEIDGQKDNFKPIPPPRTPSPNDRDRFNIRSSQRPHDSASRPPFDRYDSGPAKMKENMGSSSDQRSIVQQQGQRCDTFWEDICMEVEGYPTDQINGQFYKNKNAADTMLADVRRQSADNLVDGVTGLEERKYSYTHYYGNRRQGEGAHLHRDFANEGGFICPSEVIYGRPKRVKNSRGEWKYVVNFGEYTQTMRFEKCLKPGGSCSYLAPHFLSQCSQVYNFHRLLAWDDKNGLHVDIFKVPSGCSCHIAGYISPQQEQTPASSRINEKKKKLPKYRDAELDEPKTAIVEEFENPDSFSGLDSFVSENFGGRFPERRGDNFREKEPKISRSPQFSSSSPGRLGTSLAPVQRPEVTAIGEKPKVNYGYHPIIDFFPNHRFTAAR